MRLGGTNTLAPLQFGDVNADGVDDIVGPSILADAANTDSGAIFVWAGGPNLTSGNPAPHATLIVSDASAGARLTERGESRQW